MKRREFFGTIFLAVLVFVNAMAGVSRIAHGDDPVIPRVVLNGNARVPTGADVIVDAIGSVSLPASPIRWQVVEPSKIPAGAHILQLDSGGRHNAALVWRAPPDGTYLIASTVYGSPDATGFPTASTGVLRVIVGGPAPIPPVPVPVPPNPVPTPRPTPQAVAVPLTTHLYAVFCYHLPDPTKTTAQDLAIADLVASPTIKAKLAALNVDWHAWDDARPELQSGSPLDRYFDKAKLPLMLAWSVVGGKSVIYDANGIADNPKVDSAFAAPATEADVIQYFAKLRGK